MKLERPRKTPDTRIRKYLVYLFLVAGTLFFYLSYISPSSLDPRNVSWLNETDLKQHYLGWKAYQLSAMPGEFWTQTSLLNYPVGVPISATDSNPLYSIFFKVFSAWLPENFQFIGMVYLVNMLCAALIAFALLVKLQFDRVTAALFALLIAFPPVFYFRLGHDTLTTQWLILAHFYVVLNITSLKISTLAHGALLATGIMTHPYLFVMNLISTICDIGIKTLKKYGVQWGTAERMLVITCVTIFSSALAGFKLGIFSLKTQTLNSVGVFATDLLSLVNPFTTSYFLPALPTASGQYEGYAYLGLGGIILIIISATLFLRQATSPPKLSSPWAAIFLASLIGLTLALGPSVKMLGQDLVNINLSDDNLVKKVFSKIRSHGRFIWIAYYALLLAAVVQIPRKKIWPARLIALLVLTVQFIDLAPLRDYTRTLTSSKIEKENTYLDASWLNRFSGAEYVYMSRQLDLSQVLDITEGALAVKTPVTRFYTAQGLGLPKQHEASDLLRVSVLNGVFSNTAVHILDNEIELPLVHRQSSQPVSTQRIENVSIVQNGHTHSNTDILDNSAKLSDYYARCKTECTMVVVSNKADRSFLSEPDTKILSSINSNLQYISKNQSYVGIFRNGKKEQETLQNDNSANLNFESSNHFISVSAPKSSSDSARILVNGVNFARAATGLVVLLVYDNGDLASGVLDTPVTPIPQNPAEDLLANFEGNQSIASLKFLHNYSLESESQPFINLNRYLTEQSSIEDVLAKCKVGCSFAISVKDEATASLPIKARILAGQMGLVLSELEYREGFAAIVEDGIVLAQAKSSNDRITLKETSQGRMVEVLSTGYEAGKASSIKIQGSEFSLNKRGINLVVFNKTQEISYHFDTHGS